VTERRVASFVDLALQLFDRTAILPPNSATGRAVSQRLTSRHRSAVV